MTTGLRVELRAQDRGRDVLAIAPIVGGDVGDPERQDAREHGDRGQGTRLRLAVDQDVIDARRGRGDHRELAGLERPLIGRVVGRSRRQGVVSQEELVGGAGGRGAQVDAQGVALGDGHLIQAVLPAIQGRGQRHAQLQRRHGHGEHAGRRGRVVQLVRFQDVVEDVGADDDAILAGDRRREVDVDLGGVRLARLERAGVGEPSDDRVADLPGRVGGQVRGVGPGARGGVGAGVGDGPRDLDRAARLRRRGRGDRRDDQVRRRGDPSISSETAVAVAVALASKSPSDAAPRRRIVADRVGDDDDTYQGPDLVASRLERGGRSWCRRPWPELSPPVWSSSP